MEFRVKTIKAYEMGNVKIVMYENPNKTYDVVRLVGDKQSSYASDLDFEDAQDTYDYFLDMELGVEEEND